MDRILNMILRQLTRRLVNKGINMGINKAASMGRGKNPQTDMVDEPPTSPEQRQQNKRAAHQTRRAAKMMGRITRM
ncbi:hypothetical protein [uncultured Roseobacter sp.]|uniref:hypothetical protein n=1 Tax=uncultured Roseobacter sp. TaxID=114847 RepID=UPI002631C153|nr:hypothetical protein [uncultured Roseobacter sp.]